MKCSHCKRPIAAGVDAQKMIVEYQVTGQSVFYGYGMPAGGLSRATGRPIAAFHHKCWHVLRKREARGDVVTGRVLDGAPSAYDMSALAITREEATVLGLTEDEIHDRTGYLTERLHALRAIARTIGKGVGDPTVQEAWWAYQADGPYPHRHRMPQEMYQLRAHLRFAHGLEDLTTVTGGLHLHHYALHRQADLLADRADDPGFREPDGPDWRDQHQADI